MSKTRTASTFPPPIPEARRWLEGVTFAPEHPLINVSQAAPVDPPPLALRQAMADTLLTVPDSHLYGAVLGLTPLRAELASQWSAAYRGAIKQEQVAITSGCNQAFCAALDSLTGEGDEVIVPSPYYFNHKMWLDMTGVAMVSLTTGNDLMPDPEAARALITPRSRAIVLVTPNNPGGVEYPPALIRAFYDLARDHGIKLIIDETYRDFHSQPGAPHDLFADPNWPDTLIQLYSFSKSYRLTGHRVGAIVASTETLAEAEKFLDTVAICPSQIGQHGALWGMRNLSQWLGQERAEILDRRAAITEHFPHLAAKGWRLLGVGAYFAYVTFPHDMNSDDFARELVRHAGILLLPGTMFTPPGDAAGKRQLRIAFANIDRAGIATLFERLKNLDM